MSPAEYRQAIEGLGLNQVSAAKALGINPRTSRRYAKFGIPHRTARIIEAALANIRAKP